MLRKIFTRANLGNYAFIDSQNLNLGIRNLGWKLDYEKFRIYLKEKYLIKKAYMFIGFVPSNKKLYDNLEKAGFSMEFKPTVIGANNKIKGNIDADLVLRVMIDWDHYNKAVIVSSDGDFYSLASHLYAHGKLETVLSPEEKTCSRILKQSAKEKIQFMKDLEAKLGHVHVEKAPLKDETLRSAFS